MLSALEAYADAAMTLLGLRIVGVPTGCVAAGSIRWVCLALERVGLLDLLDVVVASEESGEVKATGRRCGWPAPVWALRRPSSFSSVNGLDKRRLMTGRFCARLSNV